MNNEFEINAFKSEDYIKDGILIRGITYHIRIEENKEFHFDFHATLKKMMLLGRILLNCIKTGVFLLMYKWYLRMNYDVLKRIFIYVFGERSY